MRKTIKQFGFVVVITAIAFAIAACGEEEEQHFHKWGYYAVTTLPGCTTPGVKTAVCKDDTSHKDTNPIDALGHDWTDWNITVMPTASTTGQATRNCQRTGCNETKTSEVSKIITSITDLETYLAGLSNNTAGNPYVVIVDVGDIVNSISSIESTLKNASEKYVGLIILDSSDYITSIAFSNCSSLTSVTIPNSVTSVSFSYCRNFTSVTIPNSVTSIAFSNCSSLTSVTIPNSVTSIAFSGCEKLFSITIPNSVTSIGGRAFNGCYSLTEVTIPSSVTSIGDWAFFNCSILTSITIPNSVTSIGEKAFGQSNNLISVKFEGTISSSDFAVDTFEASTWTSLGDLRDKYLAGGIGTYTRPNVDSQTWTKK
jgi:hypothetical protein